MGRQTPERDELTMVPEDVARTLRSALTLQAQPVPKPAKLPSEDGSGLRTKLRDDAARAPTEPPPPAPLAPPRYVFMNEIGRGGMGRVDEVFDGLLGRAVAQKCALPEGGEAYATMLISEAQTCAQLEHPAIIPVHDIGVSPDGAPYYTMRKVRGRTFFDVLRDLDKPPSRAQLLTILRQVCLAVDYAHSRGVVHRDLKPDNVIVGEFGEVYVLDWGIAALLEGSDVQRALKASFSAGSPGYMAPEQIKGEDVDARTDVFALGVMLYESLSGLRLFDDEDQESLIRRTTIHATPDSFVPPGVLGSTHLEALVRACIEVSPGRRPGSARFIADAIDEHLDGERARLERETEAAALVSEGSAVYEAFVTLEAESRRLAEEAEGELAKIPPWEGVEKKQAAWDKQTNARRIASEAARTLARAETAFLRAIGRVEDHLGARAGLARIHFREFEDAERQEDAEGMAQHLDLARAYDDGPLALELANEGELVVECSAPDAELELARYETQGSLLVLGGARRIRAGEVARLEVGSWMVTATRGAAHIRAPVLIGRAKRHALRVEWKEVPAGMVLIPGGPFLAPDPRSGKMKTHVLPDFAIGELPVTFAQYAAFLDDLTPEERKQRTPRTHDGDHYWLERRADGWHIADDLIEGEARKRIPEGRELDLPALGINWFDARAYCRWLAAKTGAPYRLPTSLEWDKAARGADGRPFPMGRRADPAFCKMAASRPEATQPEVVGAFPRDVSPYVVHDLTGGVNEWSATMADGDPSPEMPRELLPEERERQAILRGGHWSITRPEPLLHYGYRVAVRATWVGCRAAMDVTGASSSLQVTPMRR